MEFLDDLQRAFFGALYTFRIPIAILSAIGVLVAAVVAWRQGWFAAARRHPGRSAIVLAAALAVGLPLTWYVASPIWIRTSLVEPDPAVEVVATPVPTAVASPTAAAPGSSNAPPSTPPGGASPESSAPSTPVPPTPSPFANRTVAEGTFQGTDDFHFGRGTARIIETAPGTYTLRLSDFSVRNGPDLFVYLSPDRDDYARGALELGRLKATDGSFGYKLPPGTDPSDFKSAIIWCKQFAHLFAVAALRGG